jgi:hypothetical protein
MSEFDNFDQLIDDGGRQQFWFTETCKAGASRVLSSLYILRATPPDGVNFIPYMMLLGVE